MSGALVLNATYEPLGVVPWTRAICLVLAGKADVLADEGIVHSERLVFGSPSVVRLRYVVRVPYHRRAALSRRAVFARDGHRCQYCGAHADSIDHVVPRSKGGPHAWDNVVAACRPCNARKRDRSPEESGMRLTRRPEIPREPGWMMMTAGRVPADWEPFLGHRSAMAAERASGRGSRAVPVRHSLDHAPA
jgi:5-methylcytosine-specific restriction endonuclease McrA